MMKADKKLYKLIGENIKASLPIIIGAELSYFEALRFDMSNAHKLDEICKSLTSVSYFVRHILRYDRLTQKRVEEVIQWKIMRLVHRRLPVDFVSVNYSNLK